MTKHSQERGLILTSSVSRCYKILMELSSQNRERIRVCHSINRDKKTQSQILKEHEEDDAGVLLSFSLFTAYFSTVIPIYIPNVVHLHCLLKARRVYFHFNSKGP